MRQVQTELINQKEIARNYYRMDFAWPEGLAPPQAGQFLTLNLPGGPLLRRPFAFSACDIPGGWASFIYQVKGKGTHQMTTLPPGSSLDMILPLGRGFSFPSRGSKPILLAGGAGLGPIFFWGKILSQKGYTPQLIFGSQSRPFVPSFEEFTELPVDICTEDGSIGFKGNGVEYLKTLKLQGPVSLACCGPPGMLRSCGIFSQERGYPCELSLEERMACAVGACMGCVTPAAKGGYLRVCKEGPVFSAEELLWT